MKKSVLCLLVVLVAAAVPTSASDTGFYLGAGIGRSSIDILDFYPSLRDSLEQANDAFKVYGGYRILKFLAVEAGYTDLGSPQGLERNVPEHPERAEVGVNGLREEFSRQVNIHPAWAARDRGPKRPGNSDTNVFRVQHPKRCFA